MSNIIHFPIRPGGPLQMIVAHFVSRGISHVRISPLLVGCNKAATLDAMLQDARQDHGPDAFLYGSKVEFDRRAT